MADRPLRRYLRETRGPLAAAALTLPLLALHGVGAVLAPEVRNGADLVSVGLAAAFAALQWRGATPWLGFYASVAAVQLGVALYLRHRGALSPRWLVPFLVECASYAVIAGIVSGLLTQALLDAALSSLAQVPAAAGAVADPSRVDAVLISFGAGFHEELIFRVGLVAGVGRAWRGAQWRSDGWALVALIVGSALLFSLAHHVVEPFALAPFIFRSAMGVAFAGLFLARGFAVAAWTHALYDIWVLLV